jgi:hypothetical protein
MQTESGVAPPNASGWLAALLSGASKVMVEVLINQSFRELQKPHRMARSFTKVRPHVWNSKPGVSLARLTVRRVATCGCGSRLGWIQVDLWTPHHSTPLYLVLNEWQRRPSAAWSCLQDTLASAVSHAAEAVRGTPNSGGGKVRLTTQSRGGSQADQFDSVPSTRSPACQPAGCLPAQHANKQTKT